MHDAGVWDALQGMPGFQHTLSTRSANTVQDIIIDRMLGFIGVMTVTSFSPNTLLSDSGEGVGLNEGLIQQLATQDVQDSGTRVRLCIGRVVQGHLQGTRVFMKVYPQVSCPVMCKCDGPV